MAARKQKPNGRGRIASNEDETTPRAMSPEAREQQLVSLAMDLAEEQMRKGTATSQVITHFLKAGSGREKIEREKLRNETQLAKAKVEAIKSRQKIEELYEGALRAMQTYSGGEAGLVDRDVAVDA